jgi:hypothetical protein
MPRKEAAPWSSDSVNGGRKTRLGLPVRSDYARHMDIARLVRRQSARPPVASCRAFSRVKRHASVHGCLRAEGEATGHSVGAGTVRPRRRSCGRDASPGRMLSGRDQSAAGPCCSGRLLATTSQTTTAAPTARRARRLTAPAGPSRRSPERRRSCSRRARIPVSRSRRRPPSPAAAGRSRRRGTGRRPASPP